MTIEQYAEEIRQCGEQGYKSKASKLYRKALREGFSCGSKIGQCVLGSLSYHWFTGEDSYLLGSAKELF